MNDDVTIWYVNESIVPRATLDKYKDQLANLKAGGQEEKSMYGDKAWETMMSAPICTNTKDKGIPMDDMLNLLKKAKEHMEAIPKPQYDCVVTNQATWNKYNSQFAPTSSSYGNFAGLPIFIGVDAFEARDRFNSLVVAGKSPLWFVEEHEG